MRWISTTVRCVLYLFHGLSVLRFSLPTAIGSLENRRFRGVRTVYPSPVTGRSASFRLRFRFVRVVRAVRAGEAKLRGRMTSDVPNAGPPG